MLRVLGVEVPGDSFFSIIKTESPKTSMALKVYQGIGKGDEVDLKRNLNRTSTNLKPFRIV